MKYIVYITTNLEQKGKLYIGVHKTEDPDIFDGYLGSGVYVNQSSTYMFPKTPFQYAVKKYGVNAFKRSTLYVYDTAEEAFKKEKELLNKDFVKLSYNYNLIYQPQDYPIYQFDLNGNLKKKWDTLLDACDFYGYDAYNFSWAIRDCNNLLDSYWSTTKQIDVSEYGHLKHTSIYLYTQEGKLLTKFKSVLNCSQFLDCSFKEVNDALKNNSSVRNYFVSNKLVDVFQPKARLQLRQAKLYLYHLTDGFIGEFVGKEIMPIIGLHSFNKIQSAINDNKGWYKDFYISTDKVDVLPKKYTHNRKVAVYTKNGEFIEILDSINQVKNKYNLASTQINKILKGIKQHNDYIFKYSK